MPSKSAVEILVFKPDPTIPVDQRGIHENLWIKERSTQYLSVGVYLAASRPQYYFFEDCNNDPKIYSSLSELKQDLPPALSDLFDNIPQLYIMGHGQGGFYGLSNIHGPSEIICDKNFDAVIHGFIDALPEASDEITVTLEACNTDDLALAKADGQEKPFLERLSATHPELTFCGTGPWDPEDKETGFRSSGGFPKLNVPVTSLVGGVWKHGNSVIYHCDGVQAAAKKAKFSTTATTKALKTNTLKYAQEILQSTSLDKSAKEALSNSIALDRDVLIIEDLENVPGLPKHDLKSSDALSRRMKQAEILKSEKTHYMQHVAKILGQEKSGEQITDRDLLILALTLKDSSVFSDHKELLAEILGNKELLQLVMPTCGKALIADTSNDSLIDGLLDAGADINAADSEGMTALHHAAQSFYNYRKEPCDLIRKLLACGADCTTEDSQGRTPLAIAAQHSQKSTVMHGENLLALLQDTPSPLTR